MVSERTLIIATGGHSGLGLETFRQLLKSPPASLPGPYRLILLGRNSEAGKKGLAELQALADRDSVVELRNFNLLDLSNVRKVAKELAEELENPQPGQPKDVLRAFFLNAGVIAGTQKRIQDKDDKTGKADGIKDAQGNYDETLLVNHVVHLVLLNLVLNDRVLSQLTEPLRIAFTGSLVHYHANPKRFVGTFDASKPLGSWGGRDSYSASKFVQALGARVLAKRLESRFNSGEKGPASLEIIITHPGLIPTTGLARSSQYFARIFKVLAYVPVATWFGLQSTSQGGTTLLASLTRPLDDFKTWLPFGDRKPRWTQPGSRVVGAYVTTGAVLARLDKRTDDEQLQSRWWPTVADGL